MAVRLIWGEGERPALGRAAIALVCGLVGAAGSCGGAHTAKPDAGAALADAAPADLPFTVTDNVTPDPADTRADVYVPGMRKTGARGFVRVALVSADPAPPFRGQSTWTLYVSNLDGVGIPSATLSLSPYVPDHGHGAATKPVVTAGALPGVYVAAPVSLTMQVLWVTTVDVTLPDGRTDSVAFGFLIGA
ncbi:MAG: hypothetical protein ABUL77_00035 [Bacteroidota bacterium]